MSTSSSTLWSISAACSSPPSWGYCSAMFQPSARPRSTRSTPCAMNKGAGTFMIVLLLGGCTVGPDYHPAAPAALGVPEHYAPPITPPPPSDPPPAPADLAAWWG